MIDRLRALTRRLDRDAAHRLLAVARRRGDLDDLRLARRVLTGTTTLELPEGMGAPIAVWPQPHAAYFLAADRRGTLAAWREGEPAPRWSIAPGENAAATQWHVLFDPDPERASGVFLHRSEKRAGGFQRFFPERTIDRVALESGARTARFELPPEGAFEFAEITQIVEQGGGRWLVIGTDAGFCAIDTASGERILEEDILDFIALIPLADATSVLIAFDGFEEDHIEVWNLETATRHARHAPEWLTDVISIPGRERLVLCHADGPAELWDVAAWASVELLPEALREYSACGSALLAIDESSGAEVCLDPDRRVMMGRLEPIVGEGPRWRDPAGGQIARQRNAGAEIEVVDMFGARERWSLETTPPQRCLFRPSSREVLTIGPNAIRLWSPEARRPEDWVWSEALGGSRCSTASFWGRDRFLIATAQPVTLRLIRFHEQNGEGCDESE